jgi:hypothetical protein
MREIPAELLLRERWRLLLHREEQLRRRTGETLAKVAPRQEAPDDPSRGPSRGPVVYYAPGLKGFETR